MPTATNKRRTIGEDPLDALIPGPSRNGATTERKAPARPARARKVRATYHLPEDVVQAARDAAVALSGPPARLTLSALVEEALRREVARLQEAHNRGKAFPRVEEPLVGGRPLGRQGEDGPTGAEVARMVAEGAPTRAQERTASEVGALLGDVLAGKPRGKR